MYGKLSIKVPRDRNSEFTPQTLVPYKRNTQNLEETIILLYKRGMTTREIGKLWNNCMDTIIHHKQ